MVCAKISVLSFIVYRLSIFFFLCFLFSCISCPSSPFSFSFSSNNKFKRRTQISFSNIKRSNAQTSNSFFFSSLFLNLYSLFLFLSSYSFSSLFSFSSSFLDPVLIPVLVSCQPHPFLSFCHSSFCH